MFSNHTLKEGKQLTAVANVNMVGVEVSVLIGRACLLGSTNLDDNFEQDGSTPLIAAMRCYVTSKLGKYIYIPEVLKRTELSERSVAVDLSDDSTTGEMSIVPADLRVNAFKEPINIVPGKVQLLIKRQVVDFYPCTFSMGNGPM